MRGDDVVGAAAISLSAFGVTAPQRRVLDIWEARVGHCLRTDPDGAIVAEQDGRLVGVAEAIRRDRVWILSLLAVDPAIQSAGVGRALLGAALDYAGPDDAGLIISSSDPRAIGLYGLAGFAPHPTFEAHGSIDLAAMPSGLADVSDGAGALDELGEISRAARGATHALELPHALYRGARILRLGDRGFAVAQRGHGVWLLAARDEPAAVALLWHALAEVGETEQAPVRWITAQQQWAIAVVLRAGLRLVPSGPVCVRGLRAPLHPYLPSPTFA
jgi:GNAT superfamily N-acetyltransferase